MTLFCGGSGFNFRYIGSKVLPLNTEVSSRADGISQSLQFINFQRRAAARRWSEIWVCLAREEVGAWSKGRLPHWQLHKDQRQRDQRRCRYEPLRRWSTAPRMTIHSSLDEKARPLNGSAPEQGPTSNSSDCVRSVIITALQSGTLSKEGHALLAL